MCRGSERSRWTRPGNFRFRLVRWLEPTLGYGRSLGMPDARQGPMLFESRPTGRGVLVDGVKVMRSNRLRTWRLIAVAVGATGPSVISAAPDGSVVPRTSIR